MKKFLLTVALILAVVTSLTAGTMAAYTAEVAAVSDDVVAKTFVVTENYSSNFTGAPLKIGPGDSGWYSYTIKNNSEVPVEIVSSPVLTLNEAAQKAKITMKVFESTDKPDTNATEVTKNENGTVTRNLLNVDEVTYWLYINWEYDKGNADNNKVDTELRGKDLGKVSFGYRATQNNESNVYDVPPVEA